MYFVFDGVKDEGQILGFFLTLAQGCIRPHNRTEWISLRLVLIKEWLRASAEREKEFIIRILGLKALRYQRKQSFVFPSPQYMEKHKESMTC